jgi:hypothetical protein
MSSQGIALSFQLNGTSLEEAKRVGPEAFRDVIKKPGVIESTRAMLEHVFELMTKKKDCEMSKEFTVKLFHGAYMIAAGHIFKKLLLPTTSSVIEGILLLAAKHMLKAVHQTVADLADGKPINALKLAPILIAYRRAFTVTTTSLSLV